MKTQIKDIKKRTGTNKDKIHTWSELIDKRKHKNRKPGLIEWEDKYSGKLIAEQAGCPVPKTYFVTEDPTKIPFNTLPSKYVVKANHLAGTKSVFLVKDGINLFTGNKVSYKEIIKVEKEALKKTVSPKKNEWATGKIKPKIMVEELLPDLSGQYSGVINDYKCYTFHGKVCLVKMDHQRNQKNAYTDYFDRNCNIIDWDQVCLRDKRKNIQIAKPNGWDKMISMADHLGAKFKQDGLGAFLRIDFYLTPNGPYFGEFTLYPGSGAKTQFTKRVDRYMGLLWKMPEKYLDTAFSKEVFSSL